MMNSHALSTLPQTNFAQFVVGYKETQVDKISHSELPHHCHQENSHHGQGEDCESCYGYELFRCAFMEKDEQAWTNVYELYTPLVRSWVERNASFAMTGEDSRYFVNRAFEKMWQAISAEKFTHFSNLKSLLQYLKMCVNSIIVDHVRTHKHISVAPSYEEPIKRPGVHSGLIELTSHGADEIVMAQMLGNTLWEQIEMRLKSEQERLVIYGSYVLALKPRELLANYPNKFQTVDEIYQVKQNVLSRLRRDHELLEELRT